MNLASSDCSCGLGIAVQSLKNCKKLMVLWLKLIKMVISSFDIAINDKSKAPTTC
jgi:hypothetical protein